MTDIHSYIYLFYSSKLILIFKAVLSTVLKRPFYHGPIRESH